MPQANLRTCLILLSVVTTASSQTLVTKPLPKQSLERYDNPPLPLAPAEAVSRALISQFGPYTSYQVNLDANGNNIIGDAANEPSICIDPTNGNKMSIGWRQFDHVASNFRQAGFAYTANGGTTWTAPGVLQHNVFRSDPVFFTLAFSRTFLTIYGDHSMVVTHGRISGRPMAATNSGLPSITPTARGMGSSTNSGALTEITTVVDSSADRSTVESAG
jgi:hypothetical protein